ncbi:MAG: type IV secretion system DNA-binding domain-containing protein [Rhodobacteraceae bacterium]|nr:type IV secretion system DNA-binding domain-containing protein [Paracoccaceae bacterium]
MRGFVSDPGLKTVLSQTFMLLGERVSVRYSYPANAANCLKPDTPYLSRKPVRKSRTTSDGKPFSIRAWVKTSETGFVFLTGDAEHAAATRNIISTLFEVGANALMTCPESHDPKIWFLMDEVPTLNRMPFLAKSLAEIRQFRGAFVVGYQVYSQLEDIYGDKAAQTILGNLKNPDDGQLPYQ